MNKLVLFLGAAILVAAWATEAPPPSTEAPPEAPTPFPDPPSDPERRNLLVRQDTCADVAPESFCMARRFLCQYNPSWATYMSENCRATCGQCGACEDAQPNNCTTLGFLEPRGKVCNLDPSGPRMQETCPYTCRICPRADCNQVDEYPDRCPRWGDEGYCFVPRYVSWMGRYCALTCSWCGNAPSSP